MKPRILSTKKLDASVLNSATGRNLDITEQAFISIEEREREEIERQLAGSHADHVIFTSAQAVTISDAYLQRSTTKSWKICCLSGKTREALEKAENITGTILLTANNAETLAEKIIEAGIKEAVFFCGSSRRRELPDRLKEEEIRLKEIIVYNTVEIARHLENSFDGLLFFSPSAVQSYFSSNELNGHTVCFAIGSTTAESIRSFTGNPVHISKQPTQESMLELVENYFTSKSLQ